MIFNQNFYSDVEERLPDALLNYWGARNIYHFGQNMTYTEFIKESVDYAFDDVEENKLSDHINKIRASQRKKRFEWAKKTYALLNYAYTDTLNPLSAEYLKIKTMNVSELIENYEDMTLDEIMDRKQKEFTDRLEDWRLDKAALFTQFPALNIQTSKMKKNALRDDIIMTACNYIARELKFDFGHNTKSLPSPIINKPIFSLSSTKIALEEIDGVIQSIIKSGNDGGTFSVMPVAASDTKLTNLDKKDLAVYQEITRLASSNGKEENGQLNVPVNFHALTSKLHDYTVNSKDIEVVKNSITKLANRRFLYQKDNQQVDYVLIDAIFRTEGDDNNIIIRLGSVVSQAILQKDIISVSKKVEDQISSVHGKAFVHALQGLRFSLFRDSPDNMSIDLTLDFFEDCIYFNLRSYKKKASIVIDCLDDYLSHEIIIRNFSYSNEIFHIEFLPISDEDMQYYTDWLTSHPRKY